jgi:glycosyltransferase involved in cell wall biosynthesis
MVSVIVPVRDGARTIARQMRALADQRYAGSWEVIVCDNGSLDATTVVAAQWEDRLPYLRVLDASATVGAARARNAGAEVAKGDLLLFCDADDWVCPEWIDELVAALAHDAIVTGPCAVDHGGGDVVAPNCDPPRKAGVVPYAHGANLGVRREVFEALGGFDGTDPEAGAEDIDLSLRAHHAGHPIGFARGALVVKAAPTDLAGVARQWRGYGRGTVWLLTRSGDRDLVRRDLTAQLRLLAWLVTHPTALATRSGRRRWVRFGAAQVGRVEGLASAWASHLLRRVQAWRPDRSMGSTSRPIPAPTASIPTSGASSR